ncbi:AraC-like DNA-binding protein [Sphingomonas vulcanisoli]|uniref:AraC-like DNA-binding protein n=1 Tax=Sphingomonas vulcanisoli TaxID=1658060 RepID=A0ABX0TTE7_9SPHN|nr:helix-turn-helix domain-containing protein [Sphingomonas vulcanisoli]NIJ08798.1 AraC-like DNA-binding protein [Sphingomonas vulcanisoli]
MIRSGSLVPGTDPAAFGLPAGTALRYERPDPVLQPLLPSYAVLDSDPAVWKGPDAWVLPGWGQLWIVLTSGTVTVRTRKRQPTRLGSVVLYGNSSRAMPVTSQGGVTVVVDLSPAGWARLIDRPADDFRDQIVPLDRFWPPDRVQDLLSRLHASDRGEGVKAILDDFFLSQLPEPHRDEPALADISRWVREVDTPPVSAMVKQLGISQSALLRVANRHLGYPPKLLMRRTRFLRALTGMMMAESPPAQAGIPSGYHDVPHFLRDANEFLGTTPRRFLALPMPYLRSVLRARAMVIGAPLPLLDPADARRNR